MCPRATVEHGGSAMASAHSFGELEEYIDLDLSSCGGEYELRVCRSKPEEMLCRGRLHKVAPRPGTSKLPDAEAIAGCGRRSTATVAPLQQHSHVRSAQPARMRAEGSGRRRKAAVHATLQASRAFFRSLFARTSCSDERCHGGIGVPPGSRAPTLVCQTKKSISAAGPTTLRSSIEQEKLMDEEQEQAASIRQRKSFSGVIRWRPLTATAAPAPTPTPTPTPAVPSSSTRRNSCGSVPAPAALKRSSSCRSESEGLIQGAIAYCKRSQQQRVLLARKSVSDAAL